MTMSQQCFNILLAASLFFTHSFASGDEILLRFDRLVDGTGQVLQQRDVLVAQQRIVAIGDDLDSRYPSAQIIKLDGLTAIPGLIDVHVHMTYGLPGGAQGNA